MGDTKGELKKDMKKHFRNKNCKKLGYMYIFFNPSLKM